MIWTGAGGGEAAKDERESPCGTAGAGSAAQPPEPL